ncbi:hypothetical protein FYM84_17080 [Pseudomonas sp. CAH-1]|uniref:hypothetical protein n=1 Tax=Pseudomonas sp. CAH-1 TaxID=2605744 RepID=UPI0012AE3F9F|nr:hypothetical protein [Pseudomonas sp. CAH-1]MRT62321.1 hypothetical protein [Pseudomonas sp. CAH-1]
MSDVNYSGFAALLFGKVTHAITNLPHTIFFHLPAKIADLTRAEALGIKIGDRVGFGNDKVTEKALGEFFNSKFADAANPALNGDLEALREKLIPKDHHPFNIAYKAVPACLEYTPVINGTLYSGQPMSALSDHYWQLDLLANCYKSTRGLAMGYGLVSATVLGGLLAVGGWHLIPMASAVSVDAWSPEVVEAAQGFRQGVYNVVGAVGVLALFAAPFALIKRIAGFSHDLLAAKLATESVFTLAARSGLLDKSKDEKAVGSLMATDVINTLAQRKEQFEKHEYLTRKGDPVFRVGVSDGTARARGSMMGYEAGTVMFQTLEEKFLNWSVYGRIGSGKTTSIGLPQFEEMFDEFAKHNIPFQGLGMDAKASLYIDLLRILRIKNYPSNSISIIGVEDGQYGIPIFHGKSPDENMAALTSLKSQDGGTASKDFFSQTAEFMADKCVRFAFAFSKTEAGRNYAKKNSGINPYSPYFCNEIGSRPELLFTLVKEFIAELKDPANRSRATALWTQDVKMAVSYFFNQWNDLLSAPETVVGVMGSLQNIFNPFLKNGEIAVKFGMGKTGPGYLDPADCLNGKFFFLALSSIKYGAAAKYIANTCKSAIFAAVAVREVEWKKAGKNPQSSPVILFSDEHQESATTDSGSSSGLDDTTALNKARSMGLINFFMTQSREAYEMKLGNIATQNFEQQMITKVFLSTDSDSIKNYIKTSSGEVWRLNTFDVDINANQAIREQKFGGIMYKPVSEPLHRAKVSGFMNFGCGQAKQMEMISYRTMARMYRAQGLDMDAQRSLINPDNSFRNDYNEHNAKQELEYENTIVTQGNDQVPLFDGGDLMGNGNYKAIISLSQWGITVWERFTLEPEYKKKRETVQSPVAIESTIIDHEEVV